MYVCGPTVYDYLHVGNFRGPIFFNLVRNWLEKTGFSVVFVYNYTDVDDRHYLAGAFEAFLPRDVRLGDAAFAARNGEHEQE